MGPAPSSPTKKSLVDGPPSVRTLGPRRCMCMACTQTKGSAVRPITRVARVCQWSMEGLHSGRAVCAKPSTHLHHVTGNGCQRRIAQELASAAQGAQCLCMGQQHGHRVHNLTSLAVSPKHTGVLPVRRRQRELRRSASQGCTSSPYGGERE
jgi:hypothetical protein